MFHDKSWKSIYFWIKGDGRNVFVVLQTQRNVAVAAAYVSYAGFSQL